jgi:hypothetical protein
MMRACREMDTIYLLHASQEPQFRSFVTTSSISKRMDAWIVHHGHFVKWESIINAIRTIADRDGCF